MSLVHIPASVERNDHVDNQYSKRIQVGLETILFSSDFRSLEILSALISLKERVRSKELLRQSKIANHHSSILMHYDVVVAYVSVSNV